MDGRELLRRLALRWPLVLVGLLLAIIVGGIVFAAAPASYTAQAGVLVLPPRTDPGDGGALVNPLSALDSGVVQVASTLVFAAGSAQAADVISDASGGGSATVVNTSDDPTNDTPFIQITATGASAADATSAARATIGVLGARLTAIQASSNVPRALLMRLTVLIAPVAATASTGAELKAGGLAAAIVLVLALLLIALLDRFLPTGSTTGRDLLRLGGRWGSRLSTTVRGLRRPRTGQAAAEPTEAPAKPVARTVAKDAVPVGAPARSAAGGD